MAQCWIHPQGALWCHPAGLASTKIWPRHFANPSQTQECNAGDALGPNLHSTQFPCIFFFGGVFGGRHLAPSPTKYASKAQQIRFQRVSLRVSQRPLALARAPGGREGGQHLATLATKLVSSPPPLRGQLGPLVVSVNMWQCVHPSTLLRFCISSPPKLSKSRENAVGALGCAARLPG